MFSSGSVLILNEFTFVIILATIWHNFVFRSRFVVIAIEHEGGKKIICKRKTILCRNTEQCYSPSEFFQVLQHIEIHQRSIRKLQM